MTVLEMLRQDAALALPRLSAIPDPTALLQALAAGGIRVVEFAFTTPGVAGLIEASASVEGSCVGAGTVTTAAQAKDAVAAGAAFLVTPGVVPAVVEAVPVPVIMGALTPTEAMTAVSVGAAAVKIFPASTVGPSYFTHLHGPFPDMPLVASGGLHEGNAGDYVRAGALAVTAGSSVVSAADVISGDWDAVTARARAFVTAARS